MKCVTARRSRHGAAPTTAVTHIALREHLDGKVVDWMEKSATSSMTGSRESRVAEVALVDAERKGRRLAVIGRTCAPSHSR